MDNDPHAMAAEVARAYQLASDDLAKAETELEIATKGLAKKQQLATEARNRLMAAKARLSEAARRIVG